LHYFAYKQLVVKRHNQLELIATH